MLYSVSLNLKREKSSFYLQIAVLCFLTGSAIPCGSSVDFSQYDWSGGTGSYAFSGSGGFSSSSSSYMSYEDYCADVTCLNGGTCTNLEDGYRCDCYHDIVDKVKYRGDTCQFVDKCYKLTPCDNGATCVNRPDDKGYDCECVEGFTGKRCKQNIDDCKPNPCENGAECVDLIADYSCNCDEGKVGKNCSFDDQCYLEEQEGIVPCDNNGTCLADETDGSVICNCTSAYVGPTCQAENPCIWTTCVDNAICVPELIDDETAESECKCLSGYIGQNCQFDDPCSKCDQGNCTSSVIVSSEGEDVSVDFTCECDDGWEGIYCDQIYGTDDSDSGYYDNECYEDKKGQDYRGTINRDMHGYLCQNWTVQTPWQHNYIQRYPFKGLGNHNFCRNPNGTEFDTPFCISTRNNTDGEEIPIVPCQMHSAQRSCERRLDYECYVEKDGSDYRGTVNVTEQGNPCISWSTIAKDRHRLGAFGLGDHNYCRNPDNDGTVWCYTEGGISWEYCNIGKPAYACDYIDIDDVVPTWRSKEIEEGFIILNGADYWGQRSVTAKGGLCLYWWTVASSMISKLPDSGLGNATHSHNYCRNPDNDKTVWCYVNSKNPRVEYCDIGFTWDCESIKDPECHTTPNGEDYRGRVNNTEGIITNNTGNRDAEDDNSNYTWCMNWDDVELYTVKYPEFAGHNFCRNPGGKDKHPWCFVGWSNQTGWEWSYCDLSPWSVYDIYQYQEAHSTTTMIPYTTEQTTEASTTEETTEASTTEYV